MDFGIGIINDIFAACGNVPVFRERLNSLVTTGVINPRRMRSEGYCSCRVCVSVCLSVCLSVIR